MVGMAGISLALVSAEGDDLTDRVGVLSAPEQAECLSLSRDFLGLEGSGKR